MWKKDPPSVVQERTNGGWYLGDSGDVDDIFEGRGKPTGMADGLDTCCEENRRIKDNSKGLDSADRWYLFTQMGDASGGTGGKQEPRVCLRHVQSQMPPGHPSEHVTWINETRFQVKAGN